VTFRLPMPSALVRLFLAPVAKHIFRQDARILKMQTDAIRRFGGEDYASTAVDLLGPQVWRLLEDAERCAPDGSADAAPPPSDVPVFERTVELLA
jgi:hypothetical protein